MILLSHGVGLLIHPVAFKQRLHPLIVSIRTFASYSKDKNFLIASQTPQFSFLPQLFLRIFENFCNHQSSYGFVTYLYVNNLGVALKCSDNANVYVRIIQVRIHSRYFFWQRPIPWCPIHCFSGVVAFCFEQHKGVHYC